MSKSISKIKNCLKSLPLHKEKVCFELQGIRIILYRNSKIPTPNEVTIVLPRVEINKKCIDEECSKFEEEIVLNSITIVSAPRHPLASPTNIKKENQVIRRF